MTDKYKTIIGLEIHIQLDTKSKMFCSCDNNSENAEPNTNICPICLGHPGTLPVPNKTAIEWVSRLAKALNCRTLSVTKFDRKNYFYPDLPKGYQISQLDKPIAQKGWLEVKGQKVRINRLHLEEDAAKLVHDDKAKNYSLVDFNRGGTPLVEIVTEPDITSPQQASDFLKELRLIVRYLGVSQADMEKGHLRCDANVNVSIFKKSGQEIQSIITEIKNLNSFKSVAKALEKEARKLYENHKDLEKSPKLSKITAHWDDVRQKTIKSRDKEEASDYRYFPEPDIPAIDANQLNIAKQNELPSERRQRFLQEYGLDSNKVEVLLNNQILGEYFESAVSELGEWSKNGKKLGEKTAGWILSELQKLVKVSGQSIKDIKITPENFAEFIKIVDQGQVNSSNAQVLLREMFDTGADPSQIIKARNLGQLKDNDLVSRVADEVIAENQEVVESIKAGKETALQFLLGQMMAKTQSKVNPGEAMKVLRRKILI